MKRSVTEEEAEVAWRLFLGELAEVERMGVVVGCTNEHLLQDVRRGDAATVPRIDRAVGASVEISTPSHRVEGAMLGCEILFHVNVGYPLLPPVEQCAGDVVFRMTGALSRYAMDVIAREAHLAIIELHESNLGAPAERTPRYMLEILKWASKRDMMDLVASHSAPQTLKMRKSKSRALIRFHHIESNLKTAYGLVWGRELNIRGFIGRGQPGFAMVEGDTEEVAAWIDRFTNVVHWGPTPCAVVSNRVVSAEGKPLPLIKELSEAFPDCVGVGGAFNGRNSIYFKRLRDVLGAKGFDAASQHLGELLEVYQHDQGHVDHEQAEAALAAAAQAEEEHAFQKKAQPTSPTGASAVKKKDKKKKRLQ
eukprot:TRINITY_DN4335_c1_g1_i1.p1 TRINITY_DN4335_c1_g1~~TRINITY_DN4335_c1_g1_i1.p1  ORF type:complete len:365 (+),score=124.47 TRINITY_DN4335_c1_g1_i1:149-1243(+)